jgi:hypothetical protein
MTGAKTLVSAILVFCILLSSCSSQTAEPVSVNISEESQSSTDKLQIETTLPEAGDWESAPVIPTELSERAKEIYSLGQQLGRDPNAFSKVGDCGGMPSWFLGPFDSESDEYRLGKYQYLQNAIEHFQGSYGRASLAVRDGFNAAAILSPIRADHEICEGEDPLACEYRINDPSIALIILGSNDVYHVEQFEDRLRQIIEYTIDQGVLPVLASKPDNLEGDHSINRIIYSLAVEYQIPFWNVWRELQGLPDGGLQEDQAHVTFAPNYFDNSSVMLSGWPHRNLTALQLLDFLWRQLEQPQASD